MRSLIIGLGEVGRGLQAALHAGDVRCMVWDDINGKKYPYNIEGFFDIIHVCFPYSDKFEEYVREYQERCKARYTVIHSTVPVGTSRRLNAIHSPIRGIHPNLAEGIKTFPKYLSGGQATYVADYFRKAGLRVVLFDDQETTELGKLLDTEYYRACIEFAHRAKSLCDIYCLSFHEVYTLFNESYNEGYTKLGHPEYVRPVLQPIQGPIGGHCVMNNKALLETELETEITEKK